MFKNQAVVKRAVGALIGSFVADAAAVPTHWIYDLADLDKIVAEHGPPHEFIKSCHCPYYRIDTGRNSCYGDQAYALLESLVESKGFNKENYKQKLLATFGPTTDYYILDGRAPAKEDTPVKGPWKNGSIRTFLDNLKNGKDKTGSDDHMSDGLAKVAPLVVLYAGKAELPKMVEEAVRVTQENDIAVQYAQAGASILEKMILDGAGNDVITNVATAIGGEVNTSVQEAVKVKDADHRDSVTEFGQSCALPGSFKGCVHCLIKSSGRYDDTIRNNLYAGGDTCSRIMFIGACMGAQGGLDGDAGVPKEWRDKTNKAAKVLELAEKLIALRE